MMTSTALRQTVGEQAALHAAMARRVIRRVNNFAEFGWPPTSQEVVRSTQMARRLALICQQSMLALSGEGKGPAEEDAAEAWPLLRFMLESYGDELSAREGVLRQTQAIAGVLWAALGQPPESAMSHSEAHEVIAFFEKFTVFVTSHYGNHPCLAQRPASSAVKRTAN